MPILIIVVLLVAFICVSGFRIAREYERVVVFRLGGVATPGRGEVLAKCGVEGARAKLLLQMLLKEKRLVKVSEELVYHAEVLEALKGQLAGRKGQTFGVGDFKEWTGVSRKYAIPLLELLDRERITRRVGEQRVIV